MEKNLSSDPMKFKLLLAREIVQRYHGERIAEKELQWFRKAFSKREVPEDVPVISLGGADSANTFAILRRCFSPEEKSNSEIRRLIKQGAVRIDDRIVENPEEKVFLTTDGLKLKVGKRSWFRVVR